MIAVVIAAVKNEADLIEPFVRHNLALADRMLLVDNGSSDRTLEILRQLQAEGLAVEVDQDPSLGQYQRERVTRLMQRALAYSPDWILPLDADELLLSPLKGGCFVDGGNFQCATISQGFRHPRVFRAQKFNECIDSFNVGWNLNIILSAPDDLAQPCEIKNLHSSSTT